MEAMEMLMQRRSIRKYKDQPVEEEKLDAILQAGMYAPTGMGAQSPLMVAITNQELVRKIAKMNAAVMNSDGDPFYGAPAVIIVFADTNRRTYQYDGSCVMTNLLNAAYANGLGSCWIHRAKEVFESEEGKALMKEWGVPESYVGIGNCILGYMDGELPLAKDRKENYIIKVK